MSFCVMFIWNEHLLEVFSIFIFSKFELQTTSLPHELIGSVQQIAEVFRRSNFKSSFSFSLLLESYWNVNHPHHLMSNAAENLLKL